MLQLDIFQLQNNDKIQALKRKLEADRENALKKREKVAEERKEKKRCRERERYWERKKKFSSAQSTPHSEDALPSADPQEIVQNSSVKKISSILPKEKNATTSKLRNKNTEASIQKKRLYERDKKRKQRAKIYSDPVLHKKFQQQQIKNNNARKKKGLIKPISELTKRQQAAQRKKWRESQSKHYKKMKKLQDEQEETIDPTGGISRSPGTTCSRSNKILGIKIARKNRELMKLKLKNLEKENEKLRNEAKKYKRDSDKYRKRCARQKVSVSQPEKSSPSPNAKVSLTLQKGPDEVRRQLSFSFVLEKQIKENYKTASSKEKTTMSKMMAGIIVKKYHALGRLSKIVSTKRYAKNKDQVRFILEKRRRNLVKRNQLKKEIFDFFHRDDITSQSPNKNDFVCIYKKEKTLKRFLNDTLSNLYKVFLKDSDKKISLTTFKKYKPYFVVHLKCNARNTCACIKHLNMQLKMDRLRDLKIIPSNNLTEIMSGMTCRSERSEKCMLGLCPECEIKKLPIAEDYKNDSTFYYEWIRAEEERLNKAGEKYTFKPMVKKKITCTPKELIEKTENGSLKYLEHLLNIRNQYECSTKLKENLDEKTTILNSDFSENYGTKCHIETQASHFGGSRTMLTLHTSVFYLFNPTSKKVECFKFCSVSEDVRHTAPAIFAHMQPIFEKFKSAGIKHLHIFTDGPTGQYKNKNVFFLICHFFKKFDFETVTWHFWESGHGKGPQDGVGAACKSKADNRVCHGKDIVDADTFIEAVEGGKIEFVKITSDEVDKVNELIPNTLKAVKGTFEVHQVIWSSRKEDELYLRKRSCLHKENMLPCATCDLSKPIHKLAKIQKGKPPAIAKKVSYKKKKQANVPKQLMDGWIAFKDEELKWFVGKIKNVNDINGQMIVSLEQVMSKMDHKSKYFSVSSDEVKEIFDDDIICSISSPKLLKRPKNCYSIKEFSKIEKKIIKN